MNKEKTIIKIANEIHASGGTVFCVGGAVRDEVLGLQNKDIDVEIHGISVNEVVTILKKFGETLQAALVGQFQGLSKNQLLEKFAVHQ